MTVQFYLHQPLNDPNERRALLRTARLLKRQFARSNRTWAILVGNIQPQLSAELARYKLPQLDGMVLTPHGVTLLEFKHVTEPVDARRMDRPWKIRHSRQVVHAGRAYTPYLQVKRARQKWIQFLQSHLRTLATDQHIYLNSNLLFHPYLHPPIKNTGSRG